MLGWIQCDKFDEAESIRCNDFKNVFQATYSVTSLLIE